LKCPALRSRRGYEAALQTRAPSLHAELAQLRSDPDVQKLIALEQPTRFSGIADLVVGKTSVATCCFGASS